MKNNKGFTLVEILIALALMGIVTTAIYQLYISQYKTWVSQDIVTEMQQSGRFAIDTMTREMQLAGYNLASNLPATEKAVMEASPSKFTFISTDTTITTVNERTRKISFYYDSANQRLKMDVTTWNKSGASYGSTETATLAENVTALSFLYFDDQNNTPATVDDVRRVKVSLSVQTSRKDPITGDYKSMTLVTEARPRNLGIGESITDVTPPAMPTGVQIIDPGECGKLKLKWNANTEVDLAGYTIYYSTKPSSDPNFTGYTTRKVAISAYSSYELTGLTTTLSSDATATTYYIRLDAYDTSGNPSTWTAEFSGNPAANTRAFGAGGNDTTVNISKAPAPTMFTGPGDGGNNAVHLTWVYNTDANPQVTGFRIYRSTSLFGSYPIVPNGTTIKWIAGAPGDPVTNILGKTVREFTDNDPADKLLGCVTYYYAIAAVPCDTTLISNDAGDNDTKRYIQSDYAATCGDGAAACSPGTGFAAVAGSDTAPSDNGRPPAPALAPTAGWKAVFIDIVNTTLAVTDDFSHTLVYFNKGVADGEPNCPTVDVVEGSPTYGVISNGFAVPNSDTAGVRGRFETPGTVLPFSHVDDDCATPSCANMPLNGTTRNLDNDAVYCYLGVSYDTCGNPIPVEEVVTTLAEMCGDDPVGPPGNGAKTEVWPLPATPVSASGCKADGGLSVAWNTMNHIYPTGYYDTALYRVHMNNDGNFIAVSPSDALTLKTTKQAELTASSTFTAGPVVSGVADGGTYYFGITATDCAYENDETGLLFPNNHSDWLIKGPITPGELKRDEKINGARDLHREILTGVDINNAGGTGTGASTPSTTFRHNTVTLFLENTSAGDMTIEKATVKWVNSLAYLTGVTIGGGISGKNSLPATTIPKDSSSTITDDPYTRQISEYSLNNGTIAGLSRHVPITFTFTDFDGNPYVDMRGDQVKITLSVKNDSTGTTTCVSYLTTNDPQSIGDIAVFPGPSVTNTRQNPPSSGFAGTNGYAVPGSSETANTVPSGSNGTVAVNAGVSVSIDADYQSNTTSAVTGNKIPISSVKLYYKATDKTVTTAPASGYTEVNMGWWNTIAGNASVWSGIPAQDGKRVWYYVMAVDEDGNYSRDPEIQHGAYVYDQREPDPCEVTPFINPEWWIGRIDTVTSTADPVANTVTLNWWTVACYEPDCSSSQYPADTFYYKVYRRDSFAGSYSPISAGGCSGNIVCPQGWWWNCGCTDNDPVLTVSPNTINEKDYSYYFKVVNSCDPANDQNLSSGSSNIYTEFEGCAGMTLSVNPTSVTTWGGWGGGLTINVKDCSKAGDGSSGWPTSFMALDSISSGRGDVDYPTLYEWSDDGNFTWWISVYTGATCPPPGWSDEDVLCANSADTITLTEAGASGSPLSVSVNAEPCGDTPSAPTGINLMIDDANEANRANSTSIHVKFTAPQTNTDASELVDLDHYVLMPTKTGTAMSSVNIPLSACTSSLSNPAAGTTCDYTYNGGAKMKDFVWSFSVKAVDSCSRESGVLGPKGETCVASNNCPMLYP